MKNSNQDHMENFDDLTNEDKQKVIAFIKNLRNEKKEDEVEPEEKTSSEDGLGKKNRKVRRPPASQVKQVPNQTSQMQRINRTKDMHIIAPQKKTSNEIKERTKENQNKNLFVQRGFSDLHKGDTKVDQKLSGNNQISERNTRKATINVPCNICGKTKSVSPKLVYKDDEGIRFICDKCQRRR